MAVDTREKRFSMLNFGDGTHLHATFEADGTVDLDDRQHLLDCYSGIDFSSGEVLTADTGVYTLTGLDATLEEGAVLTADTGTYVLTGLDANLVAPVVEDETKGGAGYPIYRRYLHRKRRATPEYQTTQELFRDIEASIKEAVFGIPATEPIPDVSEEQEAVETVPTPARRDEAEMLINELVMAAGENKQLLKRAKQIRKELDDWMAIEEDDQEVLMLI